MKTIYKYPLEVAGRQKIRMPLGAQIMTPIQVQQGVPCLWALVEPGADMVETTVYTMGTGHDLSDVPATSRYLGTYQLHNGVFVGHVFSDKAEEAQ